MEGNKGLLKPTIIITICSILSIIISFFSQLIIAYYFGAKFERDSFFVASTIPTYITTVFNGSIGIVFLPKVVNLLNRKEDDANNFISSVFWLMTFLLILLVILALFFSKQIILFVASGFTYNQASYTAKILILIIPTIIFNVLTNLLSSLYQIRSNFLRPALSPIIVALMSLLCVILLSDKIGIFGLAIGSLLGSILSFIILIPVLKHHKLNFIINLKNSDILSFIKTLTPLFISGILFRSNTVFERMIASHLEAGSISFLGYTNQILVILTTLTSSGIAVSVYPTLSKFWSENRKDEFVIFFVKVMRIVLLMSIPIAVYIIMYGEEFIKIIFQRGAFDANVTKSVSIALAWAMGAFVFQNIGNVSAKLFYISGKTLIISIIACFELLAYVILGLILSKHLSFIGLSIALSFTSMLNILVSLGYINKWIVKIKSGKLLSDLVKILFNTIISIAVVFILQFLNTGNNNILLFVNLTMGILTYYLFGLFLKIEELHLIKIKLFSIVKKYDRRNKI